MKFFFTAVLVFFTLFSFAQFGPGGGGAQTPTIVGKITGTIIDSNTRDQVEFATIALRRVGSTKGINGTLTDEKGEFKLDKCISGEIFHHYLFPGIRDQNDFKY